MPPPSKSRGGQPLDSRKSKAGAGPEIKDWGSIGWSGRDSYDSGSDRVLVSAWTVKAQP